MIRLFKHYVPHAVLLLGLLDFLLLIAAAEAGWVLRAHQIGMDVEPMASRLAPLLSFAFSIQTAMIAVGVYGPESLQSIRFALARLLVAVSLGVIFLSVLYFLLPSITLWRSNSLYAMGLAVAVLLLIRLLLGSMLGGEAFKRRLVVLGAGNRANRIRELERVGHGLDLRRRRRPGRGRPPGRLHREGRPRSEQRELRGAEPASDRRRLRRVR